MSVNGKDVLTYQMLAAESLTTVTPGTGQIYKAIDEGRTIAATGEEAMGILVQGGSLNEHISILVQGISKYVAGEAISAGDRLTVTTSGYFMVAGSGDHVVGRNGTTAAVSGEVGTGLFDFINAVDYAQQSYWLSTYWEGTFTPLANLAAADLGKAVAVQSGVAATAVEFANGVLITAATTAGTAKYVTRGLMQVRPTSAAITQGRALSVAAGGFFAAANSGDIAFGKLLEASPVDDVTLKLASVDMSVPVYLQNCLQAGIQT